jgi:hypothetical protein
VIHHSDRGTGNRASLSHLNSTRPDAIYDADSSSCCTVDIVDQQVFMRTQSLGRELGESAGLV